MNYLKRIYNRYSNGGLESIIYYYLKKINVKTRYSSHLDKKKNYFLKKYIKFQMAQLLQAAIKKLNFLKIKIQ